MEEGNGTKDDWRFCGLLLRVFKFKRLTIREARYLILRFYFKLKDREIAEYDSLKVSRQAVNRVFMKAYAKIKGQGWDYFRKNIFSKSVYISKK